MSKELAKYIRDAKIFNIRQLELAAGLSSGTISKAINGTRPLSERAAEKIIFVLKQCGVTPVY
ncbi:helix-turn-helix domain-containing protein [Flavihumibacter sediminis]|nr:helix-turn-helix domain-containing protein [Flavihumibacter sediminis]